MNVLDIAFCLMAAGAAAHPSASSSAYEAVIDADGVEARCGPGRKYYPTDRLRRGERIVVHRHDPGGWYMIAPPAGSFSWIRADYVQPAGNHRGIVKVPDNVPGGVAVRVGSSISDRRDVWQRQLSNGERVEILEQVTVSSDSGPTRMYKIKPPRGEFRWVEGKYVTPLHAAATGQHGRDVFGGSDPADWSSSNQGRQYEERNSKFDDPGASTSGTDDGELGERPLVRFGKDQDDGKGPSVRRSGADEETLGFERHQLQLLDARFRSILKRDACEWNFTELESDYRKLQTSVSNPALASRIDLRLAAMERYKAIKKEYDEFIQLTHETEQRDRALLALQSRPAQSTPDGARADFPQPAGTPVSSPSTGSEPPIPPPLYIGSHPDATVPPPNSWQPHSADQPVVPPPPASPGNGQQPQFDGAGIVQRNAYWRPGAPRHVLTDQSGRILAFLQAGRGINLDRYVGRSVGIYGQRSNRPDLKVDVLHIQQMQPVSLQP